MSGSRKYKCLDCKHAWDLPFGPIMASTCPKCHSSNIKRPHEIDEQNSGFGLDPSTRGRSAGRRGKFWLEE